MEEGFEPEVESVRPRGVTCNKCSRWAVAYTTLEDNPEPWPVDGEGMFETTVQPLWYACMEHATEKHSPFTHREFPPVCERCGSTRDVTWVQGMTAYHFRPSVWDWIRYGELGPPNPNRDGAYCRECGDEYRSHWTAMWDEYRAGAY